ncbi:MAG: DUF1284 domain-containing protein [Proteobacteria bacterium]|nr:MAG: DUF1284 domain-containing protein [Pseudomonadota bacterium]
MQFDPKLKFRPHHFLCAVGFQGKGYSPEFVENFKTIKSVLDSTHGDQVMIEVIERTDSICAPCPSRRDQNVLRFITR